MSNLEVEILQSGQAVDVDMTSPALSVWVAQVADAADVDLSSPALSVDVFQAGVVADVWVLAGPPGTPGAPGTPGLNGSITSVNGDAGPAVTLDASEIPETASAKILTATERTKLAGIATGATANSTDATLLARANHTGTQSADTLTDGSTNKAFLATERTKLTGIATGATANSSDATLLARANHTGTQAVGTITGLGTAATVNTGTASGDIPLLSTGGVLPVARLATGTPDGTKFVRDDGVLATPAGGGGGSGLLAYVTRTAASNSTYTTISATNADVDATNLAITFTVPASGTVVITLGGPLGVVSTSGAPRCYWSLRLSTTNVAGTERLMQSANSATTTPLAYLSTSIRLTGLTPSASVTYKWAWRVTASNTATLYYGNGSSTAGEFGSATTNNGALTIEAWSA